MMVICFYQVKGCKKVISAKQGCLSNTTLYSVKHFTVTNLIRHEARFLLCYITLSIQYLFHPNWLLISILESEINKENTTERASPRPMMVTLNGVL